MHKSIESNLVMVQIGKNKPIGPFSVIARCNEVFAREYALLHFHRQGYYPAAVKYKPGLYYILDGFTVKTNTPFVTDCVMPASIIKTYNEPATKGWDEILANPGAQIS
jgi:hypothetical protein